MLLPVPQKRAGFQLIEIFFSAIYLLDTTLRLLEATQDVEEVVEGQMSSFLRP